MKKCLKFLAILSLTSLFSCVYSDQEVNLRFDMGDKVSSIGRGKGVEVVVLDKRRDKNILGEKEYSTKDLVRVLPDANLAEVLRAKLTHNLVGRGFQYGNDKKVELQIESFSYKVRRGFVASSEINANFKMIVKDNNTGATFSRNYNSSWTEKHLIMPLESKVDKIINNFLRDMMQEIIQDDDFIESLIK